MYIIVMKVSCVIIYLTWKKMDVGQLHDHQEVEKEVRRRKKKKRVPMLPNEMIVIKNKDKDGGWQETWDEPKNRSPGCIPHSFRLLTLGGTNRGKTNAMKQLFLKHQSTARKFKKLFIITCDERSVEWLDCEPDAVFQDMPDPDIFDIGEKVCLVIDDFEFACMTSENKRRLITLFRYISTHKSVSIMASYQSFFDCPSILRKIANVFLIYKPNSKVELVSIANRIGMDADDLKDLFKQFCSGYYDFIMIDKTKNTPYPVRKNIYTIIDYESEDEEK